MGVKGIRSRFAYLILIATVASVTIYFQYENEEQLYFLFKPLTTILIILLPIFYGKKLIKKHYYGTIGALIFCLLGDVFLLEESGFVYGLSSFLIAHLFFTYSFIILGGFKKNIFSLIVLAFIGIGFYLYIGDKLDDLSIPVACYFIVIIVMCWQGINLFLWQPQSVFLSIAIAVVLFLISDAIIAIEKFKSPFQFSRVLILSTYWLSITLIANSVCDVEKSRNLF